MNIPVTALAAVPGRRFAAALLVPRKTAMALLACRRMSDEHLELGPAGSRGPFPKAEFDYLFSRVPRLTVEIVVFDPNRGVVLAVRDIPPNEGSLHLPGGTVRWGELVTDAYRRVARHELGIEVQAGELLGYIEYPSHFQNDLDSPVGLAFLGEPLAGVPADEDLPDGCAWYSELPPGLYAEQREFLSSRLGLAPAPCA